MSRVYQNHVLESSIYRRFLNSVGKTLIKIILDEYMNLCALREALAFS